MSDIPLPYTYPLGYRTSTSPQHGIHLSKFRNGTFGGDPSAGEVIPWWVYEETPTWALIRSDDFIEGRLPWLQS